MTRSFSEDFAILSAIARSMVLTNNDSGKRVICSLSLFSLGMRSGLLDRMSGLLDRMSGPASSFPGTWISLRL